MNRREFLKILGLGMVAPLAVVAAGSPRREKVINAVSFDGRNYLGTEGGVYRTYLPFDGQYITDDETLAAYGLYRYRISPDGEWVVYD